MRGTRLFPTTLGPNKGISGYLWLHQNFLAPPMWSLTTGPSPTMVYHHKPISTTTMCMRPCGGRLGILERCWQSTLGLAACFATPCDSQPLGFKVMHGLNAMYSARSYYHPMPIARLSVPNTYQCQLQPSATIMHYQHDSSLSNSLYKHELNSLHKVSNVHRPFSNVVHKFPLNSIHVKKMKKKRQKKRQKKKNYAPCYTKIIKITSRGQLQAGNMENINYSNHTVELYLFCQYNSTVEFTSRFSPITWLSSVSCIDVVQLSNIPPIPYLSC